MAFCTLHLICTMGLSLIWVQIVSFPDPPREWKGRSGNGTKVQITTSPHSIATELIDRPIIGTVAQLVGLNGKLKI